MKTFNRAKQTGNAGLTFLFIAATTWIVFPEPEVTAQGVRLTNPVLNGTPKTDDSFQNLRGMSRQDTKNGLDQPFKNTAQPPQSVIQKGTPLIQPMGQSQQRLNQPSFANPNLPRNGNVFPGQKMLRQFRDPRFQNLQDSPSNAPLVQPNAKIPRFSIPNPSIPDALANTGSKPGIQNSIHANGPNRIATDREIIKERYNNGAIKIERQVIQDQEKNYINHGFWKFYLPNGRVAAQAFFDNGKKSGAWSRWLTPKEVPLFKTAPLNQFQSPFLTTFHYVNDTLHGKWKLTDAANRTVFELNLKKGKRDSLCVWYLANGQKYQEINYKDGLLHGSFMKWNLQGKLTEKRQFEQGHEIGFITEFHQPGKKKLEYGVLAGKVESLTLDNPWNLEFATEKKIGPDIKHGTVSAWYPNGQVRFTGHFKNDVQEGDFVWYYETGQKQAEGSFSNDQRENLWVWWHENGMRASVGKYAQGSPVGNWQWWMANGQLARSQEFESSGTRLGESESNATETMKNASFRNGKQ